MKEKKTRPRSASGSPPCAPLQEVVSRDRSAPFPAEGTAPGVTSDSSEEGQLVEGWYGSRCNRAEILRQEIYDAISRLDNDKLCHAVESERGAQKGQSK